MSLHILQLVNRLSDLKLKVRTGWNMMFEPGYRYKTRCVPEAESVADHTYALAMHAFLVAIELGLDVEKAVTMALIHDAPESITGDGVTATLSSEERELALKDKRSSNAPLRASSFFRTASSVSVAMSCGSSTRRRNARRLASCSNSIS